MMQNTASIMASNKRLMRKIELEGLAKAKEAIEKRLASINVQRRCRCTRRR